MDESLERDFMYIELKKKDSVGILTIVRPKAMNALSRELVDELDQCLDQISADRSLHALILYGEKNFAAGADIKDMVDCTPAQAEDFCFSPTYNKLEALSIPTIAAMEGYALGGGLELALACDLRLASEDAMMGFPEIKLGIMPGAGGTIRAPKLIGAAKAKELIFTGAAVSAQEAWRIGLVNTVVPKGTVLAEAEKLAEKLARCAPIALRTAKETIQDGLKLPDTASGIELEQRRWSELFTTSDQKEGMRAFLEKRKPVYTGT